MLEKINRKEAPGSPVLRRDVGGGSGGGGGGGGGDAQSDSAPP